MFRQKVSRSTQGFTLIEVLISATVLAVGIIGLGAMSIGTIRGVSLSDNLTTATTLAREQLEQLARADYATLLSANYPPDDYSTLEGYEQFRRVVTVQDNTPEANMKTVTVTVFWRDDSGNTRSAELTTILTP